ncbi:MAG: hypothetical protein WKG52_08750 [Variovorax sp.]
MRFIAFIDDSGRPALGVRLDQELVDITALGLPATLDDCCTRASPASRRRALPWLVQPLAARSPACATCRRWKPGEGIRDRPELHRPRGREQLRSAEVPGGVPALHVVMGRS